jgi:hypothetical protein
LHRLGDDQCDLVGSRLEDRLLHFIQQPAAEDFGIVAVRRPEGIGRGNVPHIDRSRAEIVLEPGHAGHGQCSQGDTVIGHLAGDHLRPARLLPSQKVLAGEFPGRFDRLRPPAGEEDSCLTPWGQASEPLSKVDRSGVGGGPVRVERKRRQLIGS